MGEYKWRKAVAPSKAILVWSQLVKIGSPTFYLGPIQKHTPVTGQNKEDMQNKEEIITLAK